MKLKATLKGTLALAGLALGLAGMSAPATAAELRCDSRLGGYNYCRVNTTGGVTLIYQHTRHLCYQGDTWGYDARGVWVANGCSATFRIGRSDHDDDTAAAVGLGLLALGVIGAIAGQDRDDDHDEGYPTPDPSYPPGEGQYGDDQPGDDPYADGQYGDGQYGDGQYGDDQYGGNQYDDDYDPYRGAQIIACDSKNYKYRFCAAPVREYVQLVRQRSSSACRFNKTWGYNQNGVWVHKGCRAEFAIF